MNGESGADAMLAWLKNTWQAFQNWMRANQDAHANAPDQACCSAPPPGAGHHDSKGD